MALDTLNKQKLVLEKNQVSPIIENEINRGKRRIANSIAKKGVSTALDSNFEELAENVNKISCDITPVKGGDIYHKYYFGTSRYDLLNVAAAIKLQYPQYKCAIVGRFYKGYESIALEGADAYLTSDGDFYESNQTHYWRDDDSGKCDRYVVYFFVNEGAIFRSVTDGLCPREIVVVGHVDTVDISYNRLTNLYIPVELDSSLDHFYTQANESNMSWDSIQSISNYKEHSTGSFFQGAPAVRFCEFPDLEVVSGGYLLNTGTYNVEGLRFPKLKKITGGNVLSNGTFNSLQNLSFPALERVSGGNLVSSNAFNALQNLSFPALEELTNGYALHAGNFTVLKNLSFPVLERITGGHLIGHPTSGQALYAVLEELTFPALKYISGGSLFHANVFTSLTKLNLPELETIENGNLTAGTSWFSSNFLKLTEINFPKFKTLSNGFLFSGNYNVLKELEIPVEFITGSSVCFGSNNYCGCSMPALETVTFPNLETFTGTYIFHYDRSSYPKLKRVSFPKLRNYTAGLILSGVTLPEFTDLSLPALETMNGGYLIYNGTLSSFTDLSLPALETMNGGYLIAGTHNALETISCPKLSTLKVPFLRDVTLPAVTRIDLPEITEISHGNALLNGTFAGLTEVNTPKLEQVTSGYMFIGSYPGFTSISIPVKEIYNGSYGNAGIFQSATTSNLTEITFPNLTRLNGYIFRCNNSGVYHPLLRTINFESLEASSYFAYNAQYATPLLERIYLGYETNDRTQTVTFSNSNDFTVGTVKDIELKEGYCKPLNISIFTALTHDNIVNHILNKLGDNTDNPTLTITLGATNLAKLSDDEKAIATQKNFTLA